MRLVDFVIRQGHLSEQSLAEAVVTGERPPHLDVCQICAERAVDLSHWLDQVRDAANGTADRAFPAERLAAQQTQILRRLELLDEPARVIAFPKQYTLAQPAAGARRVASAWVGVAAAAGIFIGAIGGHLTTLVSHRGTPAPAVASAPASHEEAAPATTIQPPAPDTDLLPAVDAALLDREDGFTPTAVQTLDGMTPTLLARSTH